jgi:hypothetical protein
MHPLLEYIPVIGAGLIGLAVAATVFLKIQDRERVYYSPFERDSSTVGLDNG